MTPRPVRFLGGKGGVGKTTLAAALAFRWADAGHRTLVVSTDPAHSLGDALGVGLGDEPREIAANLSAAEISGERQAEVRISHIIADAERALPREIMPAVRRHLRHAAEGPGTVESALLDRLTELIEQLPDRWDRLVVDSAPTGHMLRLLSLPALLTPWIEGLAGQRRRSRATARKVAGMLGEAADLSDPLLERLHARRARFERLRHRLRDETAVHLVLTPERLPLAETERTEETLAEAGLMLGALVVNRVLPDDEDGLLGVRRGHEKEVRARIAQRFGERGTVEVPLLPGALTSWDELLDLGRLLDRLDTV